MTENDEGGYLVPETYTLYTDKPGIVPAVSRTIGRNIILFAIRLNSIAERLIRYSKCAEVRKLREPILKALDNMKAVDK